MSGYVWIYSWLVSLPEWATVAIFLTLTVVALRAGRHVFEGVPYDISHASAIGDLGLLAAILIAADILKRGVDIPWMWQYPVVHGVVAILSEFLWVGFFVLTQKYRSAQQMDFYHDVVIGPLFTYCFLMLAPVIVVGGTPGEHAFAVLFLLTWAALGVADVISQRMDQRSWMVRHLPAFMRRL